MKRTGLSSLALGAAALLACELPIILAVIGLGSLSAAARVLRPSQTVEMIAFALVIIGGVTLAAHTYRKRKSAEQDI